MSIILKLRRRFFRDFLRNLRFTSPIIADTRGKSHQKIRLRPAETYGILFNIAPLAPARRGGMTLSALTPRSGVIPSQCSHWRGNPFPAPAGAEHSIVYFTHTEVHLYDHLRHPLSAGPGKAGGRRGQAPGTFRCSCGKRPRSLPGHLV